ncbi:hypothetical protein HAX54_017115, partial [Datura stramonium]|nr:hypothetical protein [Datura stramonium]
LGEGGEFNVGVFLGEVGRWRGGKVEMLKIDEYGEMGMLGNGEAKMEIKMVERGEVEENICGGIEAVVNRWCITREVLRSRPQEAKAKHYFMLGKGCGAAGARPSFVVVVGSGLGNRK